MRANIFLCAFLLSLLSLKGAAGSGATVDVRFGFELALSGGATLASRKLSDDSLERNLFAARVADIDKPSNTLRLVEQKFKNQTATAVCTNSYHTAATVYPCSMALFASSLSGRLLAAAEPNTYSASSTIESSDDGVPQARSWSFTVSLTALAVELPLRSAFGTSHSITTSRKNARITVDVSVTDSSGGRTIQRAGWSEIGMPPRKPYVYEAQLDDVAGAGYSN